MPAKLCTVVPNSRQPAELVLTGANISLLPATFSSLPSTSNCMDNSELGGVGYVLDSEIHEKLTVRLHTILKHQPDLCILTGYL